MSRSRPQHLRVFLGSPGDVAEERREAIRILSDLPNHPLEKGALTIEIDAWSSEQTPMEANADGQESVVKYVGRPSECDLTVIILWSRLGTPLPVEKAKPDGTRYRSGTEWELDDALRAKKPVFLYVRTQPPPPPRDDAEREQRAALAELLAGLNAPDGSIRAARNEYDSVETFAKRFQTHLESFVARRFQQHKVVALVRRLALSVTAALALAVAAYELVPRNPTLTLSLAAGKQGLVNVEHGSVTFWIDYHVTGGEPDDKLSVEVAGEADPRFKGQLPYADGVARQSGGSWPVVFTPPSLHPGEPRWSGWVRLVVRRNEKVVATSAPQHVEVGPGAGTVSR